jgi:hypothetical protein
MLLRSIWIALNQGVNADTTGLESVWFSRPHPYETLFQIVAVPLT